MASLTPWNKSWDVFWGSTIAGGFCIHHYLWPGAAAMFTWIEDILITTSCSLLPPVRDPGWLLPEHTAVVSAFLAASHLLLCNDICFGCKGLGVSCKALIPKSPKAARLLLAGVQGRQWGCKYIFQQVLRYHKHEHYSLIGLGKSTVLAAQLQLFQPYHWCLHVTSTSCHGLALATLPGTMQKAECHLITFIECSNTMPWHITYLGISQHDFKLRTVLLEKEH